MNPPPAPSHIGIQHKNSSILPATLPVSGTTAPSSVQSQQTMCAQQQVQYQPQQQPPQQPQQPQQQQQQQLLQQQQQQLQQQQVEYQRRQQLQQHQMQQIQQVCPQQMPQVQHQQHMPHQGLVGGWQSASDMAERRKMINEIVALLRQRKPNAPQDWLKKLPQMAKRLEESLYRSASSFHAYTDGTTLKQRLQQLAQQINPSKKRQVQPRLTVPQPQHSLQPHSQQIGSSPGIMQIPSQQEQIHQVQVPQQTRNQLVNMSDINPNIMVPVNQQHSNSGNNGSSDTGLPQVGPGNFRGQINGTNIQNKVQRFVPQPAVRQNNILNNSNGARTNSQSNNKPLNGSSRSGNDRQQVLRHQQQRLLLLRHAAKCPHEDDKCPVTPHCAGMKRLWKHIAECKDQKCQVPHCVSSRYVLSHYHRCKDQRCPVCGPVREAIHRSHEKQKQMSELKQRHTEVMQQQTPSQPMSNPPVKSETISHAPISTTPIPSLIPSQKKPRIEGNPMPAIAPVRTVQSSTPQIMITSQTSQPTPVHVTHRPTTTTSVPTKSVPTTSSPAPSVPGAGYVYPNRSIQGVVALQRNVPKPQEDLTLINCFSIEQIEKHVQSLNRGLQLPVAKLKQKCLDVLKILSTHPHEWVFNSPVDPVELGLPDYFQVIKKPMDLGTIKKRLENGCYTSLDGFKTDVKLTFDNAMLYNPEGSVVYNMAKEMADKFELDFGNLLRNLQAEEDARRETGDACALCGSEKLSFEPPVFYCNGLSCSSKRIRRNSYYYVGGNNKYHWCHQCYAELKENQEITLPEVVLKKTDLTRKKNDEVREESWVHCDKCNRWIHQICGLFNTRKNKDQTSEYVCPRCTIKDRKERGITEGTSRTPMAEDLQRTKLSEHLERHVREAIKTFIESTEKEKSRKDNLSLQDARTALDISSTINIRQVTSMERKVEVRERMKKRYAFKKYPSEFTYRCKCIIVFQNLDGVDVILFGLYVYEHGEKTPLPNQRAVYLSYLDSVHYMRPRKLRTFIYHEILIAYLDNVRRRGFSTAHIWACPPAKGDDYILYAKPSDQKTPRDDRLRQWYLDMLVEAQKRAVVGKVTNMYDLYFANPKNDATVVPYMDGDYFIAEVENIIKNIEEGKNNKKTNSEGKKKKAKSKSKTKSGRGGTRSTGLDEEALAASGIVPAGYNEKSLKEGQQDYVMAKLGQTIEPMKESFIVAYLAWEKAEVANMVVPKEIEEYRKKHGIEDFVKDKTPDGIGSSEGNDIDKGVTEVTSFICKAVDYSNGNKVENSGGKASDGSQVSTNTTPIIRDGKFAAMAARKRSIEGKVKAERVSSTLSTKPSQPGRVKNSQGRFVKVLDDDQEEMDCEFLNNRQAFLELCQTNNYQFDQLRRAKHSSMMVLFHLHNRDAPKFVQQCASCVREILSGWRFHCTVCTDFDLCQECYKNPNIKHPHQLKQIPVANGQQSEITEAQRKERTKAIQLHMTLLNHACSCTNANCPSNNCTKMKGLLKHAETCQIKTHGGCSVCKKISALLTLHARNCKAVQCPVPKCNAIRERFRQLTKQQQAMDDRRRQEMNRHYQNAH